MYTHKYKYHSYTFSCIELVLTLTVHFVSGPVTNADFQPGPDYSTKPAKVSSDGAKKVNVPPSETPILVEGIFISTACGLLKLTAFLSSNSLFNTDTSFTPNTAQTDDSQWLSPADLACQLKKPITVIPTFLKIKMLEDRIHQ